MMRDKFRLVYESIGQEITIELDQPDGVVINVTFTDEDGDTERLGIHPKEVETFVAALRAAAKVGLSNAEQDDEECREAIAAEIS